MQERKDRENAQHRAVKAEDQLAMKEKEYQRVKLTLEEELQAKNQQVKQYKKQVDSYKAELEKCQKELERCHRELFQVHAL